MNGYQDNKHDREILGMILNVVRMIFVDNAGAEDVAIEYGLYDDDPVVLDVAMQHDAERFLLKREEAP